MHTRISLLYLTSIHSGRIDTNYLCLHLQNSPAVDLVEKLMATAASQTTDQTTCFLCKEFMIDNPKSLPCSDVFCLTCLQSHFKDNYPGDEVPCPMCKKEFQIPSDGLGSLQHHVFVQELDEVPHEAHLKDDYSKYKSSYV